MKTIYNTYVEMESQEQCDRMKQLCIDNGLKIWFNKIAFEMINGSNFCYSNSFSSNGDFGLYPLLYGKQKITEQEFIELLKNQ